MTRQVCCVGAAAAWFAIAGAACSSETPAAAPLDPDEAARTMSVPPGFRVTVFAAEPDVCQPIGFCIDHRGRLWVAEAYGYPNHSSAGAAAIHAASDAGQPPHDRIVIFEDTDLDGRFDERRVFFEGLNYVTGVEVGFGGAWVMSPPYFYFIPDRDSDDRPDGPPQVLLDGFGNHANAHNLANGFAWGPDGWLYATHGRTNWSIVGRPGEPEERRVRFDGGVWRYHPTRHEWEPYCDGTTNPWGIDWDDWGEAFISNCVNPHLFHVIPGAHYEPWRDRDSSRYAYARIDTVADHLHYVSGGDIREGLGSAAEDAAGGGHAHCGTMVYLGDNFPSGYRNGVFLNNIHGKRINHDVLRREGSGYVASHAPDLMRSQDTWLMGVTLQYGPDGSVYLLDWSDTGECHSVRNTQRETGRIYRVSYGTPEPRRVDVTGLTAAQLVELHLHPNDWFVRHARRVLQERQSAGADVRPAVQRLQELLRSQRDVTRRLRALWTLSALAAVSDDQLVMLLSDPEEPVAAWAVTLLCEDRVLPAAADGRFVELAAGDSTPLVRLHLSSGLQRLPLEQRWEIAAALIARPEDAGDRNLPLMHWYAIEPLVRSDVGRFAGLVEGSQMPLIRRHIARRLAEVTDEWPGLDAILPIVPRLDTAAQRDVMTGLLQGLAGRRSVTQPASWRAAYDSLIAAHDSELTELATRLALIFDDPVALSTLRHVASDRSAAAESRIQALQSLIDKHAAGFDATLLALVSDAAVQSTAIRGLAEYQHPQTVAVLLGQYPQLTPAARQDAVQTLSARRDWAAALLDAVAGGAVPRGDLNAFTARQIRSLAEPALTRRLGELWGEVRESPVERAQLMADWKKRLTPESLAQVDHAAGRALFKKLCANCHKLFDDGGDIGPNLTGAQRRNLDYLLENIFDPSASVSRDYQLETLLTDSGRMITGLILAESDTAVTVATVNERIIVPKAEIELRRTSSASLMPDGLLNGLSAADVRSLTAYLMGDQQVP